MSQYNQPIETTMKKRALACLPSILLALQIGTADTVEAADCSVARDPRRCEAQQIAREACADLQGLARSACIREALPPPDCTHAPNTSQCLSKQSAAQACKDGNGKVNRKCLRGKNKNY